MASTVVLVVGTKKGLFLLRSDAKRDTWQLAGPFLNGFEVNHATIDRRSGALYATGNNPWFGNNVACSPDLGKTWREGQYTPKFGEDAGRSVERLWRLEPGRASQPGTLFCGVDPGCLFRSEDGGETWLEEEALNNHSTRSGWGPGAGGLIVHSIVLDPADRGSYVGRNLGCRRFSHPGRRRFLAGDEQQPQECAGQIRCQRGALPRGRAVRPPHGAGRG